MASATTSTSCTLWCSTAPAWCFSQRRPPAQVQTTAKRKPSVFDGPADYTYTWSNGASQGPTPMKNVTLSNLAAGTYTVTVTDDNGCTTSASEEVKDGIPFMIIPIAASVRCAPTRCLWPHCAANQHLGRRLHLDGRCQRRPRQRQHDSTEPDHPDLQRFRRSNGDGESHDGPLLGYRDLLYCGSGHCGSEIRQLPNHASDGDG